jgi:hypothetical protein
MTNSPDNTNKTDQFQAISDRVARHKSAKLTDGQRDTMFADICSVVVAARPSSVNESVTWTTIVTGFIADVAPASGGALNTYLTDATISHCVSTSARASKSRHTLKTRPGVLNQILRAHRGMASDTSNGAAGRTNVCPLSGSQIAALLSGCESDCRSAVRGFVAHIAAGVPIGTRAVQFAFGTPAFLTSASQSWLITPVIRDCTPLEGNRLIEDDWEAVKDVASELDIALSPNIATQTYRFLAVTDERMSLAERLVHCRLSEPATSAIGRQFAPIDGAGWESAKFIGFPICPNAPPRGIWTNPPKPFGQTFG